ncbi:hypothetical protein EII22_02015 [Coriobacteriales bacterium OH1046]|nr:hypothetical protein EII22_02015 [Coriobacteriales bacterium OH1046]
MKRLACMLLVLGTVFLAASCSTNDAAMGNGLGGNTFVWENGGFGGDFTIKLNEDGTYEYSVGFLSSYIGLGTWEVESGILTLTETSGYENVFRFSVGDGELVFISEGSSQFMHVAVEDGDRFMLEEAM